MDIFWFVWKSYIALSRKRTVTNTVTIFAVIDLKLIEWQTHIGNECVRIDRATDAAQEIIAKVSAMPLTRQEEISIVADGTKEVSGHWRGL